MKGKGDGIANLVKELKDVLQGDFKWVSGKDYFYPLNFHWGKFHFEADSHKLS